MAKTFGEQVEEYKDHIETIFDNDGYPMGHIYYHKHIDKALFEAATNAASTIKVDASKIEHVWLRHIPTHNRQFNTLLYPATPHTQGAFRATQLIA